MVATLICTAICCLTLHADEKAARKPNAEVLNANSTYNWKDYMARVSAKIREKWYERIPRVAHPPENKSGLVKIEFGVLKNGKVVDTKIAISSGDPSLDEAALNAILKSSRLPRLPKESSQERLTLRFTFTYNPKKESAKDDEPAQGTLKWRR